MTASASLAGRPDITDDVAQIRAAIAKADRAHARRLAAGSAHAPLGGYGTAGLG